MKKVMMVVALVALAAGLAGCGSTVAGSSSSDASYQAGLSKATVASVQSSVSSGIKQQVEENAPGSTYEVVTTCIASSADSYKCFADVTNEVNPGDYNRVSVDVTCQPGGVNCIWESKP